MLSYKKRTFNLLKEDTNVKIFILNGVNRAGKDTFVDIICRVFRGLRTLPRQQLFGAINCEVFHLSTIDPIKNLLRTDEDLVVDIEEKSEHMRRLLSTLKKSLDKYWRGKNETEVGYTTTKLVSSIESIDDMDCEIAVFIDCREPEMINELKNSLKDYSVKTVFIHKSSELALSEADAKASLSANEYTYDIFIRNDGDLVNLAREAFKFIINEILTD